MEQIQGVFESCPFTPDLRQRNLQQRILGAAGTLPDPMGDCKRDEELPAYASLSTISANADRVFDRVVLSDFQQKLVRESLHQVAARYVFLKYFFRPDPASLNQETDLNGILTLCRDSKNRSVCTPETEADILDTARQVLDRLKQSGETPITHEQALKEINHRIDVINDDFLNRMTLTPDEKGWFSNTITDAHRKLYQSYVSGFEQLRSDLVGTLMQTDYLERKIGNLRELGTDLEKKPREDAHYHYQPHDKIQINKKTNDIGKAVESAIYSLGSDVRALHQLESQTKAGQIDGIEDLITKRPVVVAQVLLKNPEYAALTCRMIGHIHSKDEASDLNHARLQAAQAILSAAALTSGVGGVAALGIEALAARYVGLQTLKWAASHSASTGLGAAAATTFGLASGAEVADSSYRLSETVGEKAALQQASIAGAGDMQTRADARIADSEKDAATSDFIWSLLGTASGGGTLKWLQPIRKYGSAEKARAARAAQSDAFLEKLNPALIEINQSDRLKNVVSEARRTLGDKTTDRFLASITELPETERKELFQKLSSAKPDQAMEIVKGGAANASKSTRNFVKGVNVERLSANLNEVFGSDLAPTVRQLAKTLKVSEAEMLRRMSNANVTVGQALKEVRGDPGSVQKMLENLQGSLKDPKLLLEAFKDPKMLARAMAWFYRDRQLGTPDLQRMILTNVATSSLIGVALEKNIRGRDFWNEFDTFAANFVTLSIGEVAMSMTGAKRVTSLARSLGTGPRKRPDNAFENGDYTLRQRGERLFIDGVRNGTINAGAALFGYETTKLMRSSDSKAMDPESSADFWAYAFTVFSFSALNGTPRYHAVQALNSKLENDVLKHGHKDLQAAAFSGISFANSSAGRAMFITYQSLLDQSKDQK